MEQESVSSPEATEPGPERARSRTPRSLIVMLLLILPPLAWFLMWRDKTYHHWFGKILLVSAGISLAFLGFFYIFVYLRIGELYQSLGLPTANETLAVSAIGIGIFLTLLEIFYAWYVYRMTKNGYLTPFQLLVTIIFLLLNSYLTMIGPLIVLRSIYRLVGSL